MDTMKDLISFLGTAWSAQHFSRSLYLGMHWVNGERIPAFEKLTRKEKFELIGNTMAAAETWVEGGGGVRLIARSNLPVPELQCTDSLQTKLTTSWLVFMRKSIRNTRKSADTSKPRTVTI